MKRYSVILVLTALILSIATPAMGRRRMNPVNTAAAMTQSVNETANDTARINAKRRANSISYVNDKGKTIFVDTITGEEWIDSTAVKRVPPMEFPLWDGISVGVNIWDPVMRLFGQKYGLADAWVELSLHNRYKPIVEVGLGMAKYTPDNDSYTYRSPVSPYFRIGANYNFLYNSNPDYQVFAGLRYGFSSFSYSVDNVILNDTYWDEQSRFNIPSQRSTAGWLEVTGGLRVKLVGPLYAGWTVKYQTMLHQSKAQYGKPYYIPGFGSTGTSLSGSFSIIYTFGLRHLNKNKASDVLNIDNNSVEDNIENATTYQ